MGVAAKQWTLESNRLHHCVPLISILHLKTSTSRLIRLFFVVFRQILHSSPIPLISGYLERPTCCKLSPWLIYNYYFYMGDFVAVRGVSKLRFCRRIDTTINFWQRPELQPANIFFEICNLSDLKLQLSWSFVSYQLSQGI